ncbi:MAG: hypothetical protein WA063_03405 [Minisyncoccia bacterium]
MKKLKILIIALLSLLCSREANAIVFIPPVIYISTLSAWSFVTNVFLLAAFYMSVNGVVNNLYFGKPMHEVIRLLFSFIGKLIILILAAFIAIKLFDPIDIYGIYISSVFTALICFILNSLSNFRFYRLGGEENRKAIIRSLLLYTIIVFIVTFFSVSFAITTEVIDMAGELKKTSVNALAVPESNDAKNEINKKEYGNKGLYDSSGSSNSSVPQQYGASYEMPRTSIWFFPQNKEFCEIYYNGLKLREIKSPQSCFYYRENGKPARIFCPIELKASDLPPEGNAIGEEATINGIGSCDENYVVVLDNDGFILK